MSRTDTLIDTPTLYLSRSGSSGRDRKTPRPYVFKQAWIAKANPGVTLQTSSSVLYRLSSPQGAVLENRLYEKLRSKSYEDLQLAVDLLQGRQTVELVATLLNSVRRPLRTIAETLRRHARRSRGTRNPFEIPLNMFSDVWLPFQYGVKPTIASIYDTIGAYNNRKMVRKKVKASTFESLQDIYRYSLGGVAHQTDTRWKHLVSGGFTIQVVNPNVFMLERLGFLNLASIAWELVPFSFVLDRFIPIGTWARQLSDYSGCELTDGWVTHFVKSSAKDSSQQLDTKGVFMQRAVRLPSYSIKAQPIQLTQSVTHILNGVALINQIAQRR